MTYNQDLWNHSTLAVPYRMYSFEPSNSTPYSSLIETPSKCSDSATRCLPTSLPRAAILSALPKDFTLSPNLKAWLPLAHATSNHGDATPQKEESITESQEEPRLPFPVLSVRRPSLTALLEAQPGLQNPEEFRQRLALWAGRGFHGLINHLFARLASTYRPHNLRLYAFFKAQRDKLLIFAD
jgi:hypothetical protein